MIAKASGLVSIPEDLSSVAAAPLLCAGITMFSALRNAFKGHAVDTPWTRLQLAYFVGYAMWTYLTFGGVGSAGMEHYYAKYGFDMLTHAESMLVSPADVAIEHLFPPYSQAKNAALKLWFEY
jgi:hypothetical protein